MGTLPAYVKKNNNKTPQFLNLFLHFDETKHTQINVQKNSDQ